MKLSVLGSVGCVRGRRRDTRCFQCLSGEFVRGRRAPVASPRRFRKQSVPPATGIRFVVDPRNLRRWDHDRRRRRPPDRRGPKRPVIRGGGPVVTIGALRGCGRADGVDQGRAVAGGVTRTSPESVPFTGKEGVFAAGRGIEDPAERRLQRQGDGEGEGQRSRRQPCRAERHRPQRPSVPRRHRLPVAFAGGGGIDSWGTLTLIGFDGPEQQRGLSVGAVDARQRLGRGRNRKSARAFADSSARTSAGTRRPPPVRSGDSPKAAGSSSTAPRSRSARAR